MTKNELFASIMLTIVWGLALVIFDSKTEGLTPKKGDIDYSDQNHLKECEKPCCHVFYNRFCEDCKNYRHSH